jgi:hypothetical protein
MTLVMPGKMYAIIQMHNLLGRLAIYISKAGVKTCLKYENVTESFPGSRSSEYVFIFGCS